MAQPSAYTPATDFSDEELDNVGGRSTVRTAALDAELAALETTLGGVRNNLSLNQRDDGEIRDARVKLHTLSDDVLALLTTGNVTSANIRGAWLTSTAYVKLDVVTQSSNTYICAVAHTSGTFSTDLAAVRWLLLAQGATGAAAITFTPTATLASTNVQAAIDEADTENRAISSALTADLADQAVAAKGAGRVGFSALLGYAAGTVGKALQDLAAAGMVFIQAGTGAVSRTAQDKMRETVSVMDFGAKGDGVTDDTAAIQAALNAVANTAFTTYGAAFAKGGGAVYLPAGTYRITSTLKIGANTKLYGSGHVGGTAPAVATNTGAKIVCNFSNLNSWAISSATYTVATGVFAPYTTMFTGTQYDAGDLTVTHGIEISGIVIDGGGVYGGIRLLGSSGFHVHDCMVYDVAVGYLFNTCYGGQYEKLHALFSIYGLFLRQCNAIHGGHVYMDHTASAWVVNGSTRLISTFDFSPSASMPDWTDKTFAIYGDGCINLALFAHTGEHADVGAGFANVAGLQLDGYFEGNVESNVGLVTCAATLSVFANGTTSTTKYHFGVNNNVDMIGCSFGAIYVGNAQNMIRIAGGSGVGVGATDWTWNDAITFVGLKELRVATAGTTAAVYGYTTLDEALRRMGASAQRDWVVKIKDGDTVPTIAQRSLVDKAIRFESEGSGARPTISIGAAGGGFIYRCSIGGNMELTFRQVNLTFPAAPAAAATDAGLFLVAASTAASVKLVYQSGIINIGDGYSLLRVLALGSLNLNAAFADGTITAGTAAAIASVAGSAVTTSISASTTVDAGIKAIGTNGWGGTVLNSNF